MEDRVLHYFSVFQVFNDDSLEKFGRYVRIPHAFRIDNDDRAAAADTEARCFATLNAGGTEQQVLPVQQRGQLGIEAASATIR